MHSTVYGRPVRLMDSAPSALLRFSVTPASSPTVHLVPESPQLAKLSIGSLPIPQQRFDVVVVSLQGQPPTFTLQVTCIWGNSRRLLVAPLLVHPGYISNIPVNISMAILRIRCKRLLTSDNLATVPCFFFLCFFFSFSFVLGP
jgi:hypothetical protein